MHPQFSDYVCRVTLYIWNLYVQVLIIIKQLVVSHSSYCGVNLVWKLGVDTRHSAMVWPVAPLPPVDRGEAEQNLEVVTPTPRIDAYE